MTLEINLSVNHERIQKLQNQVKEVVNKRRKTSESTEWWKIDPDQSWLQVHRVSMKWEEQPTGDNSSQPLLQPDLDNSNQPLFFENQDYEFFIDDKDFVINHEEILTILDWKIRNGAARYTVKIRNNVGWHTLPLPAPFKFRFLAYPTKVDYTQDYDKFFAQVDAEYPLWLLSLDGAGHQAARVKKPHERFWLLWLKQFESLWKDLEKALRRIAEQPHNRLLPQTHALRAERIKGKISARLEERLAVDKANLVLDQKRYQVEKRTLQVDTPENRFVKQVIKHCMHGLRHLDGLLAGTKAKNAPRMQEILGQNRKTLQSQLLGPLFSQVGDQIRSDRESLVLQQRAGYSDVYRIYGELRQYLDLFGTQAELTLKSIDQLYEVWCLLEIKRLLTGTWNPDLKKYEGGLGFIEDEKRTARLRTKDLEKELKDGLGAAFELFYPKVNDNHIVKVRLAHEPIFGYKKTEDKDNSYGLYLSYATIQKPDIVLEATFADRDPIFWVFDAKYRVFTVPKKGEAKDKFDPAEDSENEYDPESLSELPESDGKVLELVPPDAINQMHRYRDALIHADKGKGKTRPTVGAFCLYPGFFDQQNPTDLKPPSKFPYANPIAEIGIGAFPLLPGLQDGTSWIQEFLSQQLLGKSASETVQALWDLEAVLSEDRYRIPQRGLELTAHQNLVLIANSKSYTKAEIGYQELFTGQAKLIHFRPDWQGKSLCKDLRYFAAVHPKDKKIHGFYEVSGFKKLNRSKSELDCFGTKDSKNSDKYIVFELGHYQPLSRPLDWSPVAAGSWYRWTRLQDLLAAKNSDSIPFLRKQDMALDTEDPSI